MRFAMVELCVIPVQSATQCLIQSQWRWLFYAPAIATGISFMLLVWLYHPPKHPRGIPWNEALRQLDYGGALLFTTGAVLVFTGVIYTTIVPSSDPRVLA